MMRNPAKLLSNDKFDLHTISIDKIKSDIYELKELLRITEVQEADSVFICRDLKKICQKYKINN
jgi:hypothetical protein